MKAISYKKFITTNYLKNDYLDHVIAVRITNGELYFTGWTENAEDYNLKLTRKDIKIPFSKLTPEKSLCDVITESEGYQSPMSTVTRCSVNPLEYLFDYVTDGNASILELSKSELADTLHLLKDGHYIIIEY